jgi:Fe-S cluster biosynthesis and repair protein YggX
MSETRSTRMGGEKCMQDFELKPNRLGRRVYKLTIQTDWIRLHGDRDQ